VDSQEGGKTIPTEESLPPTEKTTSINNSSNSYQGESRMNTYRRNEILAGIFYIIATVAPISTVFFTGFLGGGVAGESAPDYLARLAAGETQVLVGVLIEIIWTLAVVGIVVTLCPILKRHDETSALGFYSLRFMEAAGNMVSSILLLALLAASQEFVRAGAPDASYYQTVGDVLLAARDGAFTIGAGFVWSLSALLLNYVLWRSRLIPRWLSGWGLVGAVLSLATYLLQFFSIDPTDFLFFPIAVQEMAFAVWLIVKGFNLSALASMNTSSRAEAQ
jgi:hypothetical protein